MYWSIHNILTIAAGLSGGLRLRPNPRVRKSAMLGYPLKLRKHEDWP